MKRERPRKSPRVVQHFPSLTQGFDIDPLSHMLAQDIYTSIMPIGGTSERRQNFNVHFEGSEADVKKAVSCLSTLAEHRRHDEITLMCDIVQQIARHLAWQGKTVYEIIKNGSDQEENKLYLHNFTTQRLYRLPGYYIQLIPSEEQKYFKKRFVIVPVKDIWEIRMPSVLGGHSGYRRLLSRLKRYQQIGPKFWRDDMGKGVQDKNYEFQKYVRENDIYITRATKIWGWIRRDYTQEKCTEFYTFYKIVTFKRAQALLREHIVKEINSLLTRLGISSQVVVNGLPSSQDMLEIRQKLADGRIDFDKAYDSTAI